MRGSLSGLAIGLQTITKPPSRSGPRFDDWPHARADSVPWPNGGHSLHVQRSGDSGSPRVTGSNQSFQLPSQGGVPLQHFLPPSAFPPHARTACGPDAWRRRLQFLDPFGDRPARKPQWRARTFRNAAVTQSYTLGLPPPAVAAVHPRKTDNKPNLSRVRSASTMPEVYDRMVQLVTLIFDRP